MRTFLAPVYLFYIEFAASFCDFERSDVHEDQEQKPLLDVFHGEEALLDQERH